MSVYEIIKSTISKNKVLFKNFSSLSILQIANYIFPLITFPYLVRVLGPDGFGLVAFATAFVSYFGVLTDYGFNLSATREISINRNNPVKLNQIFNSVISVKIILFFVASIIVLPIVFGFSKFSTNYEIYLISFVSVLGTTFFPIWFFQGVEKMGFITVINVVVKAIWVILIFLLINNPSDILLLVALNSFSSILIGIIGLISVNIYFNISYRFAEFIEIKYQFNEAWHYFISSVSISLYTISNVFILGLFANNTVVGYFSAADKIRQAVQNLTSISGRTIFPYLSSEFKKSKETAINFLTKYTKIGGTFTFFISLILLLFAEDLVRIILGTSYTESILLLRIISFLPFIIFLSNVAGIQTMLNLGFKREFANIIIIAGILNLILSFILVPKYFEIGTAVAVVTTELFVTIQMVSFLRKNNIHVFKKVESNM